MRPLLILVLFLWVAMLLGMAFLATRPSVLFRCEESGVGLDPETGATFRSFDCAGGFVLLAPLHEAPALAPEDVAI